MRSSSDFHILLARCAKNQLFEAIVESLISLFISLLGDQPPDTKRFTRHINDHKAILQAIKKNDLKSARKRLKDHILYTYNKILRDGFRDRVPG
jgi:DNA-binding GntR family transcriptional regulator